MARLPRLTPTATLKTDENDIPTGDTSTLHLQRSRSSGCSQESIPPPLSSGPKEAVFREMTSTSQKLSYGIITISDPPNATADIVFVHGLMGSSQRTWYHEKGNIYWPKDLLSVDLPHARILAFGYEVKVWHPWNQVSQEWITGYATDLLGSLSDYRTLGSVRTHIRDPIGPSPTQSPASHKPLTARKADSTFGLHRPQSGRIGLAKGFGNGAREQKFRLAPPLFGDIYNWTVFPRDAPSRSYVSDVGRASG
ncbi:ribonuclease p/mrp subunit [Aspergillus flavus]|nr:ribonuclease p/mrp subunit [Aspergillus flavus]